MLNNLIQSISSSLMRIFIYRINETLYSYKYIAYRFSSQQMIKIQNISDHVHLLLLFSFFAVICKFLWLQEQNLCKFSSEFFIEMYIPFILFKINIVRLPLSPSHLVITNSKKKKMTLTHSYRRKVSVLIEIFLSLRY